MTKQAKQAAALVAVASLCFLAVANPLATSQAHSKDLTYSTTGHGPRILLLHDSSPTDIDWANTARELATRFEVTLIDISQLVNDGQAVQRLRQAIADLAIDDTHISGSAQGADLAHRYARAYPKKSDHFVLPQSSEDLQILAELINSNPFTKS